MKRDSPTEDTPSHDPLQDNLPPFHFRCQQGKVHSIEEGCDCKQDDKQLREALQKLEVPKMVVWVDKEMKVETTNLTNETIDQILALFQKEQIQLVSELTKTAKHYAADGLVADALDPWAVPVKELEYKKQELERLQNAD